MVDYVKREPSKATQVAAKRQGRRIFVHLRAQDLEVHLSRYLLYLSWVIHRGRLFVKFVIRTVWLNVGSHKNLPIAHTTVRRLSPNDSRTRQGSAGVYQVVAKILLEVSHRATAAPSRENLCLSRCISQNSSCDHIAAHAGIYVKLEHRLICCTAQA